MIALGFPDERVAPAVVLIDRDSDLAIEIELPVPTFASQAATASRIDQIIQKGKRDLPIMLARRQAALAERARGQR